MVEGLVSVLKQELAPYQLGQRLIAQSCDGAAVFKVKGIFSHAYFIRCYAHHLLCLNVLTLFRMKMAGMIFQAECQLG
jgi:hypothetical protein